MFDVLLPGDAADAELIAQTHPPDWVNPTPAPMYDLIVIGGGTAGLVSAAGAAGVGAKVALIERLLMGGDCLNFGCVPSKAILASARTVGIVRHAGKFGIDVPSPTIDFEAVMERMRRLRARLSHHDTPSRFRDQYGIDVFLGESKFIDDRFISVGDVKLPYRRAVIATGGRATIPEIPGIHESKYLTNENVFRLTTLPPRLAIIGGGPIACELGQAFARFGSHVTIIARTAQLSPKEDADIAQMLMASLLSDGIDVRLESEVTHIETLCDLKRLRIQSKTGTSTLEADQILIAIGRTANVEGLNLEAVGVEGTPQTGIRVDDHLRTTNRRIFAAGDIIGKLQFTHAADAMARCVVRNALFFGRERLSKLLIPHVTYTQPEIASVGMTLAEANKQGIAVQVITETMSKVDRAVVDGEPGGMLRVLLKSGSDRILGATLVATHAGDLIAPIVLAMSQGIGLKSIAGTVHAYPTQAEILKKAADSYNRTRLTGTTKWLLRQILRWRPW